MAIWSLFVSVMVFGRHCRTPYFQASIFFVNYIGVVSGEELVPDLFCLGRKLFTIQIVSPRKVVPVGIL